MQQAKFLIQQGYKYLQQNNLQQAFNSFISAVKIDENNFDAHFALGSLYSRKGDLKQALGHLRKAVEISPDNYAAQGQLGVTLYILQCFEEAINSYRKVIELQPDNVSAYANLAIAYLDVGKREEAIQCSKMAIRIKPDFSGAHALLASACSSLGKYEEAVKSYEVALKLEPDNLVYISGKIDSLNKLGMREQALKTIRPYIKPANNHPSISIAYAHVSRSQDDETEAAGILEEVLKSNPLNHKQLLQLHFAAGDLYDRMDKYDSAFKHYAAGNQLVQRSYDFAADKKLFQDIIKAFSHDAMKILPRARQQGVKPVFVVGMPRSGTSLVERILGSHSRVFPAGELNIIPQAASKTTTIAFPENISELSESQFNSISRECLDEMAALAGSVDIIIDKLPHNFLFLGLIELLFLDARIIHCQRNALDTCLSNYFQYFSGPLDYPYDLQNIARHYNQYHKIMEHWRGVIQIPMLEISYEELIQNQESVSRSMIEFIGLPWEEACLRFNEQDHVTRTASYDQVRKPVYTRSMGRWRNYKNHINKLIDTVDR